ncbi:MAG: hypothetical protein A2Y62_06725 [Candidatus Fischerbacteria bacterium RBG_13_37_8]|uniref:Uncharacterized protein n=1 Tax=Candidatus Fischerbacteria bacterium RBG_13_37_8 TaxID=1817863 RepID=A0A1F5VM95_9BACT|nr:MAG: hypothetical protein A2Y62_06725 [Candidatus Fischerbacteria bacterium RBG_13_37_8]
MKIGKCFSDEETVFVGKQGSIVMLVTVEELVESIKREKQHEKYDCVNNAICDCNSKEMMKRKEEYAVGNKEHNIGELQFVSKQ